MRPNEARPPVLSLYRLFRKQGRTPEIAMQMVRSAFIGISDHHTRTSTVDVNLPSALMADAAMMAYAAGRYLRVIGRNMHTDRISSYWHLGFIISKEPSTWEEIPIPTCEDPHCGPLTGDGVG